MSALLEGIAGWLATYALHGLALALPALALGCCGRRARAWQEALLRSCLHAPLLSSAAQWCLLGGPLPILPALATVLPASTHDVTLPPPGPRLGPVVPVDGAHQAASVPAPTVQWAAVVVTLAAASALVGVLALLRARRRLHLLLAQGGPETAPRLLAAFRRAFAASGLARPPELRRCSALRSPLVTGPWRPRVYLPDGIEGLGDDELVALAAHELAHVRGDALWLWLGAVVQALFPWQLWLLPLRRRLHLLAELRCDAAAARSSGPTALARCLVEVAARHRGAVAPVMALAMAGRPSALRVRVEAVLSGQGSSSRMPLLLALLLPVGAVATLAAAAPGVRPPVDLTAVAGGEFVSDAGGRPRSRGPATMPEVASLPPLAPLAEECAALVAEAKAELARLSAAAQDEATQQLIRRLAAQVAALERTGARLEAALERTRPRVRRAGGPAGPAGGTR